MTYDDVLKSTTDYLLLADPSVVRFILAVMIANQLPQLKPTFAFIISNSSGGKSTLLNALRGYGQAQFIDNMSTKTLVSGMKSIAQENSLLLRMKANQVMVMSDFTLMLSRDEQTVAEIMSQLRLVYDGAFSSFYGNGEEIKSEKRFGFLAAVTSALYEHQEKFAALGERMCHFRLEAGDPIATTERSFDNAESGKEFDMEKAMQTAFQTFLREVKIPDKALKFPTDLRNYIIRLAEMATKARSAVKRKKYSRDNPIEMVHDREMPSRLAKQIMNIGQGCAVMNGGNLIEDDYKLMYKVALDSIPKPRKQVMEKMTYYDNVDVMALGQSLNLPYETVKLIVQDLAALGILTSRKSHRKGDFFYQLKDEYRQLLSKFENIKMTTQALEVEKEEEPLPTDPEPVPEIAMSWAAIENEQII